jgi:hypothetical protein
MRPSGRQAAGLDRSMLAEIAKEMRARSTPWEGRGK